MQQRQHQRGGILNLATQERDAFILESLRQAEPLLRSFVCYGTECEELYQVAAEATTRAYDRAMQKNNPRAYIRSTIQHELLRVLHLPSSHPVHTLADFYKIVSFDAPRFQDSPDTLYDFVASVEQTESADKSYTALYDAIEQLSPNLREVVSLRCGLLGEGAHTPIEVQQLLKQKKSTISTRWQHALRKLRRLLADNAEVQP